MKGIGKVADAAAEFKAMLQFAWGTCAVNVQPGHHNSRDAQATHTCKVQQPRSPASRDPLHKARVRASSVSDQHAPDPIAAPAVNSARGTATAAEPRPVWRPLPDSTVAALVHAAPTNHKNFVVVAEVQELKLTARATEGGAANETAECRTSDSSAVHTRPLGSGRVMSLDSGAGTPDHGAVDCVDQVHIQKARYCAFEVGQRHVMHALYWPYTRLIQTPVRELPWSGMLGRMYLADKSNAVLR